MLRERGIQGEAHIDFIVGADGRVRNARAIHATHPEFAAAAEECVSRWTFRPGMINGRPVNVHMMMPIVFQLNQG